jgi:hypothetical protein
MNHDTETNNTAKKTLLCGFVNVEGGGRGIIMGATLLLLLKPFVTLTQFGLDII